MIKKSKCHQCAYLHREKIVNGQAVGTCYRYLPMPSQLAWMHLSERGKCVEYKRRAVT